MNNTEQPTSLRREALASGGCCGAPVRRAVTVLRALAGTFALVGTMIVAEPAEACPNCATGREARDEVWSDNFSFNIVAALLPFLAVGAIGFGAEAIGQPARSTRSARHRARDQPVRRSGVHGLPNGARGR